VDGTSGKDKEAALHYATKFGHVEATELLLALKGDVNIADSHGTTPLHHTATYEHCEVMQVLLRGKALPYHKNNAGVTALELALRVGNFEAAQVLYTRYRADGKELDFQNLTTEQEAHAHEVFKSREEDDRLTGDSADGHLYRSIKTVVERRQMVPRTPPRSPRGDRLYGNHSSKPHASPRTTPRGSQPNTPRGGATEPLAAPPPSTPTPLATPVTAHRRKGAQAFADKIESAKLRTGVV